MNKSTELLYKSLINLAAAGYKPKINSISISNDFWPCLWNGSDVKKEWVFHFEFPLFDDGPIVYFDVTVEDYDIDWFYLNFNIGYEIMDAEYWHNMISEKSHAVKIN